MRVYYKDYSLHLYQLPMTCCWPSDSRKNLACYPHKVSRTILPTLTFICTALQYWKYRGPIVKHSTRTNPGVITSVSLVWVEKKEPTSFETFSLHPVSSQRIVCCSQHVTTCPTSDELPLRFHFIFYKPHASTNDNFPQADRTYLVRTNPETLKSQSFMTVKMASIPPNRSILACEISNHFPLDPVLPGQTQSRVYLTFQKHFRTFHCFFVTPLIFTPYVGSMERNITAGLDY